FLQSGNVNEQSAEWLRNDYTYDKNGKVLTKTNRLGIQTNFEYDRVGNQVAVTVGVNSNSPQVTTSKYDKNDNRVSETDAIGNALVTSTSQYHRDLRVELGMSANLGSLTDVQKAHLKDLYTIRFEYDAVGNQTKFTDAEGYVTDAYYDGLNRLVARVNADSYLHQYEYDSAGNVTQEHLHMTQLPSRAGGIELFPTSSTGHVQTRSREYDRVNKLIREQLVERFSDTKSVERGAVEFSYDSTGAMIFRTTMPSNNPGEASRTEDTNNKIESWQYDPAGRLTRQVDPEGAEETFVYDAAGNRIEVVLRGPNPAGGTDPVRTTDFEYDLDNRQVRKTIGGEFESYEFSKSGKLTSKTVGTVPLNQGHSISSSVKTEYGYDRADRRISIKNPEGEVTTYEYTSFDTWSRVEHPDGKATRMTYDDRNRRIEIASPQSAVYTIDQGQRNVESKERTKYDRVGNIKTIESPNAIENMGKESGDATLDFITTRWYDGRGNVLAELNGDYVLERFSYDATGQVIARTTYENHLTAAAGIRDQ
ncbi:hypothetical protein MK489_25200, partial [Myxococcota bacterium]|nr:hypothetical protein [Myxococcota bacterium]